ncbi:MAG: hypothetical protein Q9178_005919 [Gyalolechia marmorata]
MVVAVTVGRRISGGVERFAPNGTGIEGGTTAFRNTLIGMFFKKTAVQQLCAGIEVTTVSVDDADSLETATAESTPATSSRSSSKTPSTTMVKTATSTVSSTTPSAVPSTISSTPTSMVPLATGNAGQGSDDGSSTASAGGSSATSPSATQGDSAGTDPNNGSGGGGNNDGTGGTVLEAASTGNIRSIHGLLPESLYGANMETTATDNTGRVPNSASLESIPNIDLNAIENSLDKEQDQAFSSLIRIFHMPPVVATAVSSVYRAALGSSTTVRAFGERNGYDTVWLWWVAAIAAYLGLFVTEIGMAMIERLVGMGKGMLWIPMLGIPLWKAGKKKSFKEAIEFFFLSEAREVEGVKEVEGTAAS